MSPSHPPTSAFETSVIDASAANPLRKAAILVVSLEQPLAGVPEGDASWHEVVALLRS